MIHDFEGLSDLGAAHMNQVLTLRGYISVNPVLRWVSIARHCQSTQRAF